MRDIVRNVRSLAFHSFVQNASNVFADHARGLTLSNISLPTTFENMMCFAHILNQSSAQAYEHRQWRI